MNQSYLRMMKKRGISFIHTVSSCWPRTGCMDLSWTHMPLGLPLASSRTTVRFLDRHMVISVAGHIGPPFLSHMTQMAGIVMDRPSPSSLLAFLWTLRIPYRPYPRSNMPLVCLLMPLIFPLVRRLLPWAWLLLSRLLEMWRPLVRFFPVAFSHPLLHVPLSNHLSFLLETLARQATCAYVFLLDSLF